MMVCAFNRAAKTLVGLGGCFFILGVIMGIVSRTVGTDASFETETRGGSTNFSVEMPHVGGAFGYNVYARADYDCHESPVNVTAQQSQTGDLGFFFQICGPTDADFASAHDPPLRFAGHLSQAADTGCGLTDAEGQEKCAVTGTYRVNCSTQCWIADTAELLAETNGGVLSAFAIVLLCMSFFLAAGFLVFIACICCWQGPDKDAAPMVAAQPAGSA